MSTLLLLIIWAFVGLLVGVLVNVLADDLPARRPIRRPHCPRCGYVYKPSAWLALTRRFTAGTCPECGLPARNRLIITELSLIGLFMALAWFVEPVSNLVIYSVFVAVLVLVVVIDQEHRLVLHIVTFPTTAFALVASLILNDSGILLALVGAVVGFIFFFIAYLIGNKFFGQGALGFGDVTLAMMMGAMLGFQRIFFALVIGILLAGLWGGIALISGRMKRGSFFAYGPFLAIAGIVVVIWGNQLLRWMNVGS